MLLVIWMVLFLCLVAAQDALAKALRDQQATGILIARAIVVAATLAAFTAVSIALALHDLV